MTDLTPSHQVRDPISVVLLTGFLGSGKTTVLNHLLRQPELSGTAVIINEFGEIGLDHELVEAAPEDLVLLQSGCLCCTVRGDLIKTLHTLSDRRECGKIPPFDRVVIETTGLADPAPILHTQTTDRFIAQDFRLDGVVVTVDAATGAASLDAQEEAVRQAAMADRLLLTKTDLADADAARALEARLRRINPGAPIIRVDRGAVAPAEVLNVGLFDPASKSSEVQAWLNAEAYAEPGCQHRPSSDDHHEHHHRHDGDRHEHHHHHHDVNRHDDRITATAYTVDKPIPADIFDIWLESLMLLCGPNILRLKAIVNVIRAPAPFVLHGVQHVFYPPVLLPDWPSDDRCSRIVLIGRDLTDEFLKQSFAFLGGTTPKGLGDAHGEDNRVNHPRAGLVQGPEGVDA